MKGQKRMYTKEDYVVLNQKYLDFILDGDDIIVKSKTATGVRHDKVTKQTFVLRGTIRLVCLKDVITKAIMLDMNPLLTMMCLHNYGIRAHKRVTENNLEHLLDVLSILAKKDEWTVDEVIIRLQATLL